MENITRKTLNKTLEHFQETTNFNASQEMKVRFEDLHEEFDDILAHTVSVLTTSIVTLLQQENVLTEQLCDHPAVVDLISKKKSVHRIYVPCYDRF